MNNIFFLCLGLIVTCMSFVFTIFFVPDRLEAIENSTISNLPILQKKVAKGYSKKFCNAIGFGLSKESALKLAIKENEDPKFNLSLWKEIAVSGEKNIEEINGLLLADIVSSQIANDCGYPIGLSNEKEIDEFKQYFIEIKSGLE